MHNALSSVAYVPFAYYSGLLRLCLHMLWDMPHSDSSISILCSNSVLKEHQFALLMMSLSQSTMKLMGFMESKHEGLALGSKVKRDSCGIIRTLSAGSNFETWSGLEVATHRIFRIFSWLCSRLTPIAFAKLFQLVDVRESRYWRHVTGIIPPPTTQQYQPVCNSVHNVLLKRARLTCGHL
jgi:hypothetical protein